jgi:hypothetical protein
MKHIALLTILLVFAIAITAQTGLPEFNKERYHINQTGFLVLSSWSVINIASGAIGMSSAHGQAKYFHQMNLIWGAVNFVVAFPGYLGARKSNTDLSLAASVKGQSAVEKTFIFNAGLDIAYMAGGAWFLQKANSVSPDKYDKYKGYGKSIVMQGAFLFLFDAVMFATHNRHGKKLTKALNGLELGPKSIGMNVRI